MALVAFVNFWATLLRLRHRHERGVRSANAGSPRIPDYPDQEVAVACQRVAQAHTEVAVVLRES